MWRATFVCRLAAAISPAWIYGNTASKNGPGAVVVHRAQIEGADHLTTVSMPVNWQSSSFLLALGTIILTATRF